MCLFSDKTNDLVTFKSPQIAKEYFAFWNMDYRTPEEERIHQEQEQQRIKEKKKSSEVFSEDSEFVHDGFITIEQLNQYEDHIHSRKKAKSRFVKNFRTRLVENMMVDDQFAAFMSKASPEYKKLVKKAEKERKKLEFKANVSGFEKVKNGVGIGDKIKAKEKLKKIKADRDKLYLLRYDTPEMKDEWTRAENGPGHFDKRDLFATFTGDETRIKEFEAEVASDARFHKSLEKKYRNLPDHELCELVMFPQVTDGKIEDSTGESIEVCHRELTRARKDTGDKKLTENELSEIDTAYLRVAGMADKFAGGMLKLDFIPDLDLSHGSPEVYLKTFHHESRIIKYLSEYGVRCKSIYETLALLRSHPNYKKITKDTREGFDNTLLTILGFYRYFNAVSKNIEAWSKIYTLPETERKKLKPEQLPKQLPAFISFFDNADILDVPWKEFTLR